MRRFSPDIEMKVCHLYQDHNMIEIAKILGMHHTSVSNILKRMGVVARPNMGNKQYSFDNTFFDKMDTQEKAYVLGILMADGNYFKHSNRISIGLQIGDREILEKIKTVLKSNHPLTKITQNGPRRKTPGEFLQLGLCDSNFSMKAEALGLVERKSLILDFPSCVPSHLMPHFVRGYFDGDGCAHIQKTNLIMTFVGTLQMCSGIKSFFETVFKEEVGYLYQPRKNKNTFTLFLNGNCKTIKAFDAIYTDASIFMDRKFKVFTEFLHQYQPKCLNRFPKKIQEACQIRDKWLKLSS